MNKEPRKFRLENGWGVLEVTRAEGADTTHIFMAPIQNNLFYQHPINMYIGQDSMKKAVEFLQSCLLENEAKLNQPNNETNTVQ